MGFLLHPSCEQIVFTMINSGVLIMLVVEIAVCSLQYKVTRSRQQVLWEAANMEMRRIFCERLQKLRGCKIGVWRWYWLRCFCEETLWVLWEDGQIWSGRKCYGIANSTVRGGGNWEGEKSVRGGKNWEGGKKSFHWFTGYCIVIVSVPVKNIMLKTKIQDGIN